jgi:hypothetical protein
VRGISSRAVWRSPLAVARRDLGNQPKAGDVRLACFVDEDMPRRQLAGEHTAFVSVVDRPGDLGDHRRDRLGRRLLIF